MFQSLIINTKPLVVVYGKIMCCAFVMELTADVTSRPFPHPNARRLQHGWHRAFGSTLTAAGEGRRRHRQPGCGGGSRGGSSADRRRGEEPAGAGRGESALTDATAAQTNQTRPIPIMCSLKPWRSAHFKEITLHTVISVKITANISET